MPAWALYKGTYFRVCIRWAMSVTDRDRIFVLSALHGLLTLETVVEPYDLKMGDPGSVDVERVREQAGHMGIAGYVVGLGGQEYLSRLRPIFSGLIEPTAHLRKKQMGFQMNWLNNHRGYVPDPKNLLV